MATAAPRVLVPLANGCEELEAVTVVDLLRRAQIEVVTAGLSEGPIRASRGVVLLPDTTLGQVHTENFDAIVLPGGQPGANNLEADARVLALLKRLAEAGKYVAAICAAPKVLAAGGVLNGRRATCFRGAIDAQAYPQIRLEKSPVVVDGNVITSRGPGTAMDFALELIRLLCGAARRDAVEENLLRPQAESLRALGDWG